MCPAHVDWTVSSKGNVSAKPSADGNFVQLERRRPKNAPVVDTMLRRGHRNNGLIEVENEEEGEEFEEITMSGVVYRLPERGIKLDFLDAVKRYARRNGWPVSMG